MTDTVDLTTTLSAAPLRIRVQAAAFIFFLFAIMVVGVLLDKSLILNDSGFGGVVMTFAHNPFGILFVAAAAALGYLVGASARQTLRVTKDSIEWRSALPRWFPESYRYWFVSRQDVIRIDIYRTKKGPFPFSRRANIYFRSGCKAVSLVRWNFISKPGMTIAEQHQHISAAGPVPSIMYPLESALTYMGYPVNEGKNNRGQTTVS